MEIAFFLYKYFPFGGLQRDFIQILSACQKRGHQIRVYTMVWDGEIPAHINVIIIPVKAHTNHGRNEAFYHEVKIHLTQHPADVIVGFNKMPGLDIYYAADVCYAEKVEKEKGFFYKLTKRYKHYIAYEKAVFDVNSHTKLLMLTQHQIDDFKKHYKTPDARFYLLPPGIDLSRKYDQQIANAKQIYRKKNAISKDQFLLLQVGSDFKRKGVDRTLKSIASLPNSIKNKTMLMVVGQDSPTRYQRLAKKLAIDKQVLFFHGRNDIAELMAAADVLIHPAYQEAAGIVLIEAIAAGLPVITTEICGYAPYIKHADCGIVINEPYRQKNLNNALATSLANESLLNQWAKSARHFADTQDLYSLPEKAADIILGCQHA
ncbi:glycosyltransferase family 4 protein [Arsenophonus nasoniae]|uniref:Glycosyltransferase family 4 protein n=1 Tax=Arsenophonus nasoniae TaxID=638 RepID=A0A4P7KXF6_9GAMM|nr:glycosyltransferase family 4 protein [Arsenophonus nasoniae]QBY42234.1 Lipopolysaccharide core biosynthesis protein RfaG [Arsenophonus nasoniae]WGM06390.1 glycosyltransferase family 4 protein [Arsenophonus nasoniae]WGM11323.1 glycosyltransferase family 4 protein [Arsenophonus nasoniae]WGM16023.1 glycosyltransferase family 4 protein [Arsenophonus nasoniae]